MTDNPARSMMVLPYRFSHSVIILLCCAACVLCGCSVKKRPSIPWAVAVQARPAPQHQPAETSTVPVDLLPDLQFELPPFPGLLGPIRPAPPRPRNGTPTTPSTGTDAEKPQEPTIAPQITPQETVVAQQQTNQSLSVAEKNLELVLGKNLNAAQSDLVSKINGFLKDAREAARISDWSRARSLAKKAQVLSEELAGSF
jgi:hypothetical protein